MFNGCAVTFSIKCTGIVLRAPIVYCYAQLIRSIEFVSPNLQPSTIGSGKEKETDSFMVTFIAANGSLHSIHDLPVVQRSQLRTTVCIASSYRPSSYLVLSCAMKVTKAHTKAESQASQRIYTC
jgi:hypothetical protein